MRGMKLRLLVMGVILMVLSLILYFGKGGNDALFFITGVGALLFILGLVMN